MRKKELERQGQMAREQLAAQERMAQEKFKADAKKAEFEFATEMAKMAAEKGNQEGVNMFRGMFQERGLPTPVANPQAPPKAPTSIGSALARVHQNDPRKLEQLYRAQHARAGGGGAPRMSREAQAAVKFLQETEQKGLSPEKKLMYRQLGWDTSGVDQGYSPEIEEQRRRAQYILRREFNPGARFQERRVMPPPTPPPVIQPQKRNILQRMGGFAKGLFGGDEKPSQSALPKGLTKEQLENYKKTSGLSEAEIIKIYKEKTGN
jgi:hypothetical protein